jgi:glycosyltransferase involved in cell wall biosynthesis
VRILLPAHYALVPGGISTVFQGLAPALRALLGDDLVVPEPRPGPLSRAQERVSGPAAGAARLAYEQLALPRLAARCDSVHLCDSRTVLATRTPVVLTVHDVSYLDHPEWFGRAGARYKRAMLAASLARRPAAVVCSSAFTRDRLLAHHPRVRRAVVIHPGVAEPPADRPARRPGDYFLTVGAVEPRKNLLTLLRAYRLARGRGLELRWKVAGPPGAQAGPILAALRAAPGVEVLGRVAAARLEELYAGARFLAAPSWYEGFGYPPLEAMARDVPVVCASGSGLEEVAGAAAIVVDPADVEEWARVSFKLAGADADHVRLVTTGRERVRRLGWTTVAGQVVALHEETKNESRRLGG